MRRHLILRECTASQSSQPDRPPSPARPLPHLQMTGLPDSLGTVLSETDTTVSLSAAPTIACQDQLAHSSRDINLFPVNNPSLETDQLIFATGTWVVCQKTPPPTELQIPATVTTPDTDLIWYTINIAQFDMIHHASTRFNPTDCNP